jgi:hypothetical protein
MTPMIAFFFGIMVGQWLTIVALVKLLRSKRKI